MGQATYGKINRKKIAKEFYVWEFREQRLIIDPSKNFLHPHL
jgi:hypothetical protein